MAMEEIFDDDEEVSSEKPDAQGSVETVDASSQGWLTAQLDKYSKASEKSEKAKSRIMAEATAKLLARQKQLEEPDWFGIASAFGKPTRTGSFGESLSNVNEVLSSSNRERRAANQQLEDLRTKYQLSSADADVSRAEKELGFGIQLQKALPKAKQFEIQSLEQQLNNMKPEDPRRKTLQGRIDKLNYIPPAPAKTEKQLTLEQWANQILVDEEKAPGTHPEGAVTRAKEVIKKQTYIPQENKPVENLTLEQWANKTLSEETKTPGTHSKADIARANSIMRKATYITPEKGSGSGDGKEVKAQSPAGKIAADKGFKPGTPEFNAEVKKIVQSGKHLSATQERELFEQEDIVNGSQSALLNLDKALKLSPKAYEGGTANVRRAAGRFIPGIQDSDAQAASSEFSSIMGEQMLSQLKAIFGGNPTEGERRVLADLQGSLNMSHTERKPIIQNAMAAVRRRLKAAEERAKGIRAGAYSPDVPEMAEGGVVQGSISDLYKFEPSLGPMGLNPQGMNSQQMRPPMNMAYGGPVRMQQGGTPPSQTDTSGDYSFANFGRAVGQGLGMSFGDEAIARVRAQMEGRPYDDVLAEERAAYEAFAKKHPIAALSTELASGLGPTVGAMFIPGGQVAAGANVVRAAPTMARLAARSGLMGGISGFGAGEGGVGNRLASGAQGATFGAIAGPTLAKTANLVGKGYNAVKDKLNPSIDAVNQAAMRKVLQAMGRDDMDVNAVRQRMARDQQLGVKSSLADSSPAVTNLAEAVVTLPGKGKKQLGQKLENRLEEGRDTVGQRAQQSIAKGVDYTAQEDSLVSALRKNAKTVYDQAYAHGAVDDPRIMSVLEDNTFKKAYEQARNIIEKEARAAELRGEDASKFKLQQIYSPDKDGKLIRTGEIPDVRTLDYLKRGIDALIEQGYGSNKSISKAEAGALRDLKNAFVGVIDDIAPDYKAARAAYAGDIEVIDALRYGRTDYLSPKYTPAKVLKDISTMSDAEKDALRAGVAQSLLTKITETPNQINAAQRVIGAPSTRKRLAGLFDNPLEYKLFEEALMRESELFRNAQNILRGSRTEMKKQAIEDLKRAPGLLDVAGEAVDFATAGPGSMVGRVLKMIQSRATFDEKTANEVANILKSGTTAEINAALSQLEQSAGKFAAQAEKSNRIQKGVANTVGMSSGKPPRTPEPEAPEESDDERLRRLLNEPTLGE